MGILFANVVGAPGNGEPTNFPATTGWDPVTGLGTPNAFNLLNDLINYMNTH